MKEAPLGNVLLLSGGRQFDFTGPLFAFSDKGRPFLAGQYLFLDGSDLYTVFDWLEIYMKSAFEDCEKQPAIYLRRYNSFPMRPIHAPLNNIFRIS